jgi:hypothetical protein
VRFQVLKAASVKMTVLIALGIEAASTSEMSINFYLTTRCNVPEDSNLQYIVE